MRKIKTIKVCSSVYDIHYEDKLLDGETFPAGLAKLREKLILIAQGEEYAEQLQKQTILHEAFHIISEEYQFLFDEDMVERLSNAVYAFMIDNSEFIQDIIGDG